MFWVVLICRAAMLRVAWHYNMQMKASSERCSAWRRTETSPDKNIFFCIKSRRNCHLIKSIWLLLLGELCSSFYLHQDEVDLLPRHCRAASRNPNKYKWSSFLFRRQYLTYFFINLQQHLCLLLRLWGWLKYRVKLYFLPKFTMSCLPLPVLKHWRSIQANQRLIFQDSSRDNLSRWPDAMPREENPTSQSLLDALFVVQLGWSRTPIISHQHSWLLAAAAKQSKATIFTLKICEAAALPFW